MLALMATGVSSGDEVITTPFTFVATAKRDRAGRREPRFSQTLIRDLQSRPESVARAITSRTRAVIPVQPLWPSC